jgi:molybdate transport system substrate-binding protein
MRIARLLFCIIVITTLFTNCGSTNAGSSADNNQLNIAISANMRFAMADLELAFEKETGIVVEFTTASSGVLTTQIEEGAPFDLFLCADLEFPEKLFQSGSATTKPKVYANGTLVMWTTCDLTIPTQLQELAASEIRTICLPNPTHAPYGMAAVQALKSAGVWDSLNATNNRIIYGESVADVNQKTMLCAVDLGITNKSVLFSPNANAANWVEIDSTLYSPIQQGIVTTKHGAESNSVNAQKFYDFVFSEKAQQILKKYGYKV